MFENKLPNSLYSNIHPCFGFYQLQPENNHIHLAFVVIWISAYTCNHKHEATCCLLQVETEGLRRSIQNLGVLLTTAAVAHTSVATGEGLRHAATGQHHTITVTTKDKVLSLNDVAYLLQRNMCTISFR